MSKHLKNTQNFVSMRTFDVPFSFRQKVQRGRQPYSGPTCMWKNVDFLVRKDCETQLLIVTVTVILIPMLAQRAGRDVSVTV